MVPFMSQGAAIAVEDAAALAEALRPPTTFSSIHRALDIWQGVRTIRANQMQQASLINGAIWHFPDGPQQEARDEAMKASVDGRSFCESSNMWSDPVTQAWCYGYDAEEEIRGAFKLEEMGLVVREKPSRQK